MNRQNNVSTTVDEELFGWLNEKVTNEDKNIAKILRRLLRQEMEREINKDGAFDTYHDIVTHLASNNSDRIYTSEEVIRMIKKLKGDE